MWKYLPIQWALQVLHSFSPDASHPSLQLRKAGELSTLQCLTLWSLCTTSSSGRSSTWWRAGWSGSILHSRHNAGMGPEVFHQLKDHSIKYLTWTRGQEGSSITAPAFAARAPLRKVGPRLTVTLANLKSRCKADYRAECEMCSTKSWIDQKQYIGDCLLEEK